ncbi:MAG: DegT/DnrJ/EryC1/StrS family aminotransferase, partial [Planctomycetaceae bacterium]
PPPWPRDEPWLTESLQAAIRDGSWGRYHGPWCGRLEEALRQSMQCEHVHLTCSGTAAVELALRALGVRAADEVVLAAYDFKGNFQDVLALGATPVLVDVCPQTFALDVSLVAAALTPRTRAVIASHLHGAQVDMRGLTELLRGTGVGVLEDACQAPLATVQGRIAGGWGDVATLSFGGSKLLTAGRGGAVLTNQPQLAQRLRLHTQRGNDAYPLSELQAAALVPQLTRLPAENARRAEAVEWLSQRIARSAVDWPRGVLAPLFTPHSESAAVYYKWGLRYSGGNALPRGLLTQAARAEGVALDGGLRALHKTHASRRYRAATPLTNATLADESVLTLHHPVLLEGPAAWEQVVAGCERIWRHRDALRAWWESQTGRPEASPEI